MSFSILIVDDDEDTRQILSDHLRSFGYEITATGFLAEARDHLQKGNADLVLLDVWLPDGYGPSLLNEISADPNAPPIILITGAGDIEMAVDAMQNGAHDFLIKPIKLDRLDGSIQRAKQNTVMRRELMQLRRSRDSQVNFVIGSTPQMQRIIDLAHRAAQTATSVLITGDTGTGKELLARYIHRISPRADHQFVDISCSNIQMTMFESELFGHEAGAFTDATKRKIGLMEVADEGILFLDEISSMPLEMQSKLLRVLQERSFRRVGGNSLIRVDVHLLAASNRNLPAEISKGKFRSDLFYRLKVIDLHLPPLRERKVDIPELVGRFIHEFNQEKGLNITGITPRAMEALMQYNWPGNIRELNHAIESAMIICDDAELDLAHLPSDIVNPRGNPRL